MLLGIGTKNSKYNPLSRICYWTTKSKFRWEMWSSWSNLHGVNVNDSNAYLAQYSQDSPYTFSWQLWSVKHKFSLPRQWVPPYRSTFTCLLILIRLFQRILSNVYSNQSLFCVFMNKRNKGLYRRGDVKSMTEEPLPPTYAPALCKRFTSLLPWKTREQNSHVSRMHKSIMMNGRNHDGGIRSGLRRAQ